MSKLVQNELLKYLGHDNRGSRKAKLAVIRRSNMPGILTEAAFMSHKREAKKLKSDKYRQKQALAIYTGLKKEFGVKDAPKPKPVPVVAPKPKTIVKPVAEPEITGPTKLEVQYPSKFGNVRNEGIESQIRIPRVSGSVDLITIKNIGNNHAAPKIVFTDLLGNKTSEVKPFIKKKGSYGFKPKNIGGANIGSIDIIESDDVTTEKDVSKSVAGLSAGVIE